MVDSTRYRSIQFSLPFDSINNPSLLQQVENMLSQYNPYIYEIYGVGPRRRSELKNPVSVEESQQYQRIFLEYISRSSSLTKFSINFSFDLFPKSMSDFHDEFLSTLTTILSTNPIVNLSISLHNLPILPLFVSN